MRLFPCDLLSLRALTAYSLLLSSLWWHAGALRAQPLQPPVVSAGDVQLLLRHGEELERQRRWSEALVHYEEALRTYPGSNDLERRLSEARVHFDLARRYADASYLSSLESLGEQESLEVFGEVLLKIQTHFVTTPNWSALMEQGLQNVGIALTEPGFVERHTLQLAPAHREQCCRELASFLRERPVKNRHEARALVVEVAHYLSEHAGIPPTATILEFTCGAVNCLDEYSNYLTGSQLDEVFSQIEGNFVGLGVELKADQGSLLLMNVITGGPAQVAGLRPGHRIIAVDGRRTEQISADAAADLLKGPEGSRAQLVIALPDGTQRSVDVERRRIEVPSVDGARILDPAQGVAYLNLTSFQKTTSRDLDAALWKLHREGMRILIVDVRGNPGGLLTAAVEVADKFVSTGTIVSTRGRNSREDADYKAHVPGTWRVPLIVLIDGDSASASEIFAAAIHDNRRGTVVGSRSYGKGSVQGIFPLNAFNAGLRLTTAKFYSPNGQAISRRGVTPDVVVHATARPVDGQVPPTLEDDAALNAALSVAREQLSRR